MHNWPITVQVTNSCCGSKLSRRARAVMKVRYVVAQRLLWSPRYMAGVGISSDRTTGRSISKKKQVP